MPDYGYIFFSVGDELLKLCDENARRIANGEMPAPAIPRNQAAYDHALKARTWGREYYRKHYESRQHYMARIYHQMEDGKALSDALDRYTWESDKVLRLSEAFAMTPVLSPDALSAIDRGSTLHFHTHGRKGGNGMSVKHFDNGEFTGKSENALWDRATFEQVASSLGDGGLSPTFTHFVWYGCEGSNKGMFSTPAGQKLVNALSRHFPHAMVTAFPDFGRSGALTPTHIAICSVDIEGQGFGPAEPQVFTPQSSLSWLRPWKSTSQQVASQQVASQQVAPQQVAPQQVAPQQVAPQQVASQQVAPQQVASQQVASQQVAPQQVAPQQVAPQQVASEQVTSPQMASQQVASPQVEQVASPQMASQQQGMPPDVAAYGTPAQNPGHFYGYQPSLTVTTDGSKSKISR
ncbi:hypothetical protein [Cupriavidus necator]